ncbi:MAG: hypothetical protein H6825_13640 [Planctomycetes bacterium]|nr:hypothetical protein [Planctomycetota bacterium]
MSNRLVRFPICSALLTAAFVGTTLPHVEAQVPDWDAPALTGALPPRSAAATAYDPVSERVVLFGGYNATSYKADTFVFDGTGWARVQTPVAPSGRAGASMAFDEVTQKLVLFGGFDGSYKSDTWLWDGSTQTWSAASPSQHPTAVTGPSLFTDPVDGHVDAFGGFSGQFYQLDTWRWTGSDWTKLTPAHKPSARAAACCARDEAHGGVLLFGGLASVNPWNTWLWDGSDWHLQSPSFQPANRYNGAAAYDDVLHGVVVFGGASAGEPLDDSWLWTGAEWTPLAPAHVPPARESHGMAWMPGLGRIVVAGGEDHGAVESDTWTLTAEPAFLDVGPGLGGTFGVPALSGGGDLAPGSVTGFTLDIGATSPGNLVLLFFGADVGAAPFHGGTFYPLPLLLSVALTADGTGQIALAGSIPLATPAGASLVMQAWMPDAGAPLGAAGTNGLALRVP